MDLRVIAKGLKAPEGPVALADGSVIVCEMAAARLTRVLPNGSLEKLADTGGTPNGAAIGPDGALYVCNRGVTEWRTFGEFLVPVRDGRDLHGGGSIQRVDLHSGAVTTIYTHCGGRELNGPNDLVFDAQGGMYFTDFGHIRRREVDRGSVHYASIDGKRIDEVCYPLSGPNGIGLSPDGRSLYVAETFSSHLYRFELKGPGHIERAPNPLIEHGGWFVGSPSGFSHFDSLALDSAGRIVCATIGVGLTVFSPDGSYIQIPLPDPATTNVCFGGENLQTAFVTATATGQLMALQWDRPGLQLQFNA